MTSDERGFLQQCKDDPVFFCRKVLGIEPWSRQQEILHSVRDNPNTIVVSANAMGKSFCSAAVALWWLFTRSPSTVLTTAPCYDSKTEILTEERGFVLFKDLLSIDRVASLVNGQLQYVLPEELFVEPYSDELIGYSSSHLDFLVTPNHRCYVDTGSGFRIERAHAIEGRRDLVFSKKVTRTGSPTGLSLKMLRLLGLWFADGYARVRTKKRAGGGPSGEVTVTQSKNIAEVKRLCAASGHVWHDRVSAPQKNCLVTSRLARHDFVCSEMAFAKWVCAEFGGRKTERRVPLWLKRAPQNEQRAFLSGVLLGDGHTASNKEETSRVRVYKNRQYAEDLYELAVLAGYAANMSVRASNGGAEHDITLCRDRRLFPQTTQSKRWYRQAADGHVYCVKVPSGVVLVRRNGTCHWSGNTFRQVMSVLWAEVTRMYYNARIPLGGELTQGKIVVSEKDKWFALGIPSSDEVRFQGYHNDNVLVIFDEAAGIEPHIYTAASGNLVNPVTDRFLLIGNPTSPSGMFYDYSKNPNWHKITLNALESPAITEPEKYPYLASKRWCEERKEEWGESSPMYQARVLGRFPEEGEDTLFPMSWVNAAVKRYEMNNKDLLVSQHSYLGVDVARMGGDKTVCATYQPNRVLPLKKQQGKDLPSVKHMIGQEAMAAGTKLMQITIDATGLGGGPCGDLREMQYPVVEVNFAHGAQNKRFFRRLKDEVMWNLHEVMRAGEIALPPDDEMLCQLTSMKYKTEQNTGLIEVESNEARRSRGLKSADCAWAVALAVWGAKRIRVTPGIRPRGVAAYSAKRNEDRKWY